LKVEISIEELCFLFMIIKYLFRSVCEKGKYPYIVRPLL